MRGLYKKSAILQKGSMSCLRDAGLVPAGSALFHSLPAQKAGRRLSWRCQILAPERHVQPSTPLRLPCVQELAQQYRHKSLPKQEPRPINQGWSRQEAIEQNLICRMMFNEEPRWDFAEYREDPFELPVRARHLRTRLAAVASTSSSDPSLKTVHATYGGRTNLIKLQQGCSDDMVEQLIRDAFDLCADRVICLRNVNTGAVTAAHTQIASGTYEVVTDEDQDVARHLPVESLSRIITPTATQAEVGDALSHCSLGHLLPELKRMSGAQLLSLPLDTLQSMYSMSGWRLRAVKSFYLALHPPVTIKIVGSSKEARVASAKEFSGLLHAQGCVALRACDAEGAERLAMRFEDLKDKHVYSPVHASGDQSKFVGLSL